MGRQIQIHMLADDALEFLKVVRLKHPVICTPRDAQSVEIVDSFPSGDTNIWCLWNQAILPTLTREPVDRPIQPSCSIDSSQPVIEWWLGRQSEWDGRRALAQGRLYARFERQHEGFREWFDSLVQWIRKNYERNPVKWQGGYIGPAALQWHREGGLLLPHLPPPLTDEWRDRMLKQQRSG